MVLGPSIDHSGRPGCRLIWYQHKSVFFYYSILLTILMSGLQCESSITKWRLCTVFTVISNTMWPLTLDPIAHRYSLMWQRAMWKAQWVGEWVGGPREVDNLIRMLFSIMHMWFFDLSCDCWGERKRQPVRNIVRSEISHRTERYTYYTVHGLLYVHDLQSYMAVAMAEVCC